MKKAKKISLSRKSINGFPKMTSQQVAWKYSNIKINED